MLYYSPEERQMLALARFNWELNDVLSKDLARFDLTPEPPKFRFPTLVIRAIRRERSAGFRISDISRYSWCAVRRI